MKNGNLITLQATELDAVAGGAASAKSILNNVADGVTSIGLPGLGKDITGTLNAAGQAVPLLDKKVSIPGILNWVAL
ncbi:hypothetical protein [Glaciimonas sp. PAMC28666]|uniref:hypothetical protein n=1 Tax=Glaciimonas sp. PAMC28666 TaxID=2807626 RepID=UPI00196572A7|nr:hypothetical protein [Glaciimonas sp. PAMC28666]QRX83998.1 hypothetical protein JQN73_07260 [Glaciimonas sp. PAMC28666]